MVKKTLANIPKRKNQPFKSAAMMHTALYLIGQQYGTASSRTTIQTINDRQNRPFMKLSFSHQKKKKKNKVSLQPIFLHLCSLSVYTIIRTFRFSSTNKSCYYTFQLWESLRMGQFRTISSYITVDRSKYKILQLEPTS